MANQDNLDNGANSSAPLTPTGPDPKPLLNRGSIAFRRQTSSDDRDSEVGMDEEGHLVLLNVEHLEESSKLPAQVAVVTFVVYISLGLFLGMHLEGWDFQTTIYFIIATLTTVGYGDYTLANENRFLGSSFVLIGVVFVGAAFGVIVDYFRNLKAQQEADEHDEHGMTAAEVQEDLDELWAKLWSSLREVFGVIMAGAVGFYVLENFVAEDYSATVDESFYWATVTVTTVGYGDVVPKCDATRTFATLYICVAFLSVANAMVFLGSMPLELRKLRQQNRVLTQFGSCLDADELGALMDCEVVNSLRCPKDQGRRFVTRAEFALWVMLQASILDKAWLNKCFFIFDQLDVDGSGHLDEQDIAEIVQDASRENSAAGSAPNLQRLAQVRRSTLVKAAMAGSRRGSGEEQRRASGRGSQSGGLFGRFRDVVDAANANAGPNNV